MFGGPAAVPAAAHTFVADLADLVRVEGDDGHHLQRVRRLRVGETVTAADGRGAWRTYRVRTSSPGALELEATSGFSVEPELTPRLVVAFSLTKHRPETVVQQLTELGVDGLVVLAAARSVARWDARRAPAALERLRRVVAEAGAQCRRARLPGVDGPVETTGLIGHPGLVVADPVGMGADELPAPPGGEWLVAVGPEGGFDDGELAALAGAPRLRLGPFVLRAQTAAVAAGAVLAQRRRHVPERPR
jgi:16S rRNA (uracil1498-N3)-methyltransferase